MQQETIDVIKNNPKYAELVSKRTKFAWILSASILIVYYSFILVIAFAPGVFGMKVGAMTTLGIPVGIAIILFAFLITGIYVYRANGEFDRLTNEIKQELK